MTIYKLTIDATHFWAKKLIHAIETATLNPCFHDTRKRAQNIIIKAACSIGPPQSQTELYSDEISFNYLSAPVILPADHDFLPKHRRKSGLRFLASKTQVAEQNLQDRKIDNNFIDDRLSSEITTNTTSSNLNIISAPTTSDFATTSPPLVTQKEINWLNPQELW